MTTFDTVRILCPNEHPVTVPNSLLGRELICPKCNSRFVADAADSLEAAEERIERAARQWLWVAVAAVAMLVAAGLGLLFAGLLS